MELEAFHKLEESLLNIFEYLKVELIAELQRQGHNVTGDLIDSIENETIKGSDFIREDVSFAFYGRFVDTGRKAGIRRVPIDVLEEWIVRKGFESDAKKVKGMAFAIQKTIFDKGISQPTSWKGTDTANWMTSTVEKNEDRISQDLAIAIDEAMDIIITNIINDTNTVIKQNQSKSSAA